MLSPLVSPALGPSGSSSATPNLAGNLAEVVAMLVKCGAVRLTGSAVASTTVDGISESPDAVASAVALALWSELLNPVVISVCDVDVT